MILKTRTANDDALGGWIYIDRICKAQSYGQITAREAERRRPVADGLAPPTPDELDEYSGVRLFQTQEELREYVDAAWGPLEVRASWLTDELWPEFHNNPGSMWAIVPVRLERDDGSCVLALLGDETYLLSDDGHTIDKLRG